MFHVKLNLSITPNRTRLREHIQNHHHPSSAMAPPERQRQPHVDTACSHSQGQTEAELTPTLQFQGGLSPPSHTTEDQQGQNQLDRSDTLTFPTLESDGSLPDLRAASSPAYEYRTPPAALSSLGAKARMANNIDMASSVDSLEDGSYDMLDDLSETTNDDRETASLVSTEHAVSDDEGEITHDEDEGEEFINFNSRSVGDLAGTLGVKDGVRDDEGTAEANRIIDSYMSDDLETPRQSTIRPSPFLTEPAGSTGPSTTTIKKPAHPQQDGTPIGLSVVLYCLQPEDYSRVAPKLGDRIATSLAGGHPGACDIIALPPTPDNSRGRLMCRYDNMEVTIDRPSGSEDGQSRPAPPKHQTPDLCVVYLSNMKGQPVSIHASRAKVPRDVPTLIITKTREDRRRVEEECDHDMLTDEEYFFSRDEVGIRLRLLSLLSNSLLSKGWRPFPASQKEEAAKLELPSWVTSNSSLLRLALGALLLALLMPTLFSSLYINNNFGGSKLELETQRGSLSTSLKDWTNNSKADFEEVLSHLLPHDRDGSLKGVFVLLPPAQVAVSVIDDRGRPTSGSADAKVWRPAGTDIACNVTMLTTGVYGLTLPLDEVYGVINFNLTIKKPVTHVAITHDFGSRVWQRKTFEKAGTDLAKAINKDVAVARKAAKSLSDRFGLELTAGVAATQNVTSQLAVRMTRDVQIFARTAVGALGKAASQSVTKAEQISKDLAIARKDLIKRADDVKKSLATTAHSIKDLIVPSKKIFTSPLAVSRQRALGLKDAVAGKKQDARVKSVSPTSDLTTKDFIAQIERELSDALKTQEATSKKNKPGKCGRWKAKRKSKGCR